LITKIFVAAMTKLLGQTCGAVNSELRCSWKNLKAKKEMDLRKNLFTNSFCYSAK